MKNLSIVLSLVFLLLCGQSFAQQEDYGKKKNRGRQTSAEQESYGYDADNNGKKWDWTKARIGGSFAFSIRSGGIFLDASPTFGYQINKYIEVGAGFTNIFQKQNNVFNNIDYKAYIFGPIVYARATVWQGIFLMAQYEMTNKPIINITSVEQLDQRINVHHLLLGGGYSQSLGDVGNLNISLLYDVIDDPNSNYRFGTFGDFPLMLNIGVGFGINRRNRM